jgi:hypothetical protein
VKELKRDIEDSFKKVSQGFKLMATNKKLDLLFQLLQQKSGG